LNWPRKNTKSAEKRFSFTDSPPGAYPPAGEAKGKQGFDSNFSTFSAFFRG
jgi:hypothetical protein